MKWAELRELKPGDVIVHPSGLEEVVSEFNLKFSLQWAVCKSGVRVYWGMNGERGSSGPTPSVPPLEEWDIKLPPLDFSVPVTSDYER